MDRKNIKVFGFVAGTMILVLSGRNVESGVVRSARQDVTESSDDTYPFIDGLRIRTERPVIDTSDLEERETDGHPLIDGIGKIPRRFGLPEVDLEGAVLGSDGEFPFTDGLRKRNKAPRIPVRVGFSKIDLEDGAVLGNEEFPFRDGLRRTTEKSADRESIFDNGAKLGNDGEFPFVDGLRDSSSSEESDTESVEDFKKTDEEYPFVNGLHHKSIFIDSIIRDSHPIKKRSVEEAEDSKKETDSEVEDFKKTDEEYPFINGLHPIPIFIDGIISDSHSIKKRSVGAFADSSDFLKGRREISSISVTKSSEESGQVGATSSQSEAFHNGIILPSVIPTNAPTDVSNNDVHRFAPGRSPSHQGRGTRRTPRFKVAFGDRKEGDSKLFEKVIRKPIQFGVNKIIVNVPFPEANMENNCPINYVIVRNAQTIGDLEDDDVTIASGGIGQTNVTVKITSPNFYLYSYRVIVYGICPN